jgi:hypothetical protein
LKNKNWHLGTLAMLLKISYSVVRSRKFFDKVNKKKKKREGKSSLFPGHKINENVNYSL